MRYPVPLAMGYLGLLLAAAACGSDHAEAPGLTSPDWALTSSCGYAHPTTGDAEEEVFGAITGLTVEGSATLRMFDKWGALGAETRAVPINRLAHCHKESVGGGHANEGAEFGWYSTVFPPTDDDFHCDELERHRAEASQFPNHDEAHCINPGRYLLTLGTDARTTRPVDFLRYDGVQSMPGDTDGTVELSLSIARGDGAHAKDVIVDYSSTTGASLTPVIEISPKPDEFVESSRWAPLLLSGSAYHLPANYTLRLGSWKTGGGTEKTLVRYFWNCCADTTFASRSGFTNIELSSGPMIQTHQYPAPDTVQIMAHLVQPWHLPSTAFAPMDVSYGHTASMTVIVHESLTVSISASPTTADTGANVVFTAGGSNGGGGNQYRWEFGDGTSQNFSSSPTATHSYGTTGSKTVVVRKKDQYGYERSASMSVTIEAPPPPPPPFAISIYADHDDQQNIVRANQTCRWMANPYSGATYQWYKLAGVWKLQSSANPFSLGVGPAGTTWNLRVIGTRADGAKDTLAFTVNVTSGGSICGPW